MAVLLIVEDTQGAITVGKPAFSALSRGL